MKLLSSPTSNSSSSPFHPNLCTSRSATASFLTGILRRILCFHTLPTHPSDHLTVASRKPGIVGRLMGLDSFPDSFPETQHDHKHLPLVPSKFSILEMPTFFELENEEFLILTFSKRETCSGRTKHRRSRKGASRSNENTAEKVLLEHTEDKKIVLRVVNDEDSTKSTRSFVQQEDCCSQDSSPVSVLDKKSKIIEETCQPWGNKYSSVPCGFTRQGKICRLAQDQVEQCNWELNNVEDISRVFGLGILDQLLQELVESL